jgi:ABC-type glutathione transport system ATPase component
MVTHRSDIVSKFCNRLLFLKNGELVLDSEPLTGFRKLQHLGEGSYMPVAPFLETGDKTTPEVAGFAPG